MQVTLIDKMGSDLTVVNAARVSFHKESEWEVDWNTNEEGVVLCDGKTETHSLNLSQKDQKLISYLAKNNHWTPFSHVMITMREKIPIFVARQRFKHMVGFTYNEVSRRYVDDDPEYHVPDVWRERASNKKQGSGEGTVEWLEHDERVVWDDLHSPHITTSIKEEYKAFLEYAEYLYKTMIKNDVAPEQARMVLPQSLFTEYYCTGSLAAWARAYKLRSDLHAQLEIQELAKKWNEVISGIDELKHSWKALIE